MASREGLIFDLLKGKDTLTGALKNTKKAVGLLDKSISTIGGKFTGLGGKLAAVFGTAALIRGAIKAVETAKSFENALIGLRSVAQNTGNDLKTVEQAAQDLAQDGLIPLNQASNSVKTLLASGLSIDKATELLNSFKDAAAFNRQGQLELGDAIERATQGFKNRLSINVDNVGLTKNLSQIEREYTAETGKSTKALDEKALSLVLANGLIKEAAVFQGDYNKLLDTFTGASSKTATAFTFLAAEIGSLVTNSPEVVEALSQITLGVDTFTKSIKENSPALSKIIGGLADFLVITPSKFWLDYFAGNVGGPEVETLAEKTKRLRGEIDQLQALLVRSKTDKDLLSNMGISKTQVLTDIGAIQNKLREFREEEKRQEEVAAQTSANSLAGKAANDAKVRRAQAVSELLNQFREEEAALQIERDQAAKDAEELKGEERLLAIQTQLEKENKLKELAGLQEKASAIKNDKELQKFKTDAGLRDLKALEKTEKAKVNLEQKTAQARVNIASGAANLISAVTKDGSKIAFLAQKAASIAGAVVATNLAAAQALATPPAPNVALATSAKIAGGLNVAAITATAIKGFNQGGILDGRPAGDNNVAAFNGDEMFLTKPQQKELFEIAKGNTGGESAEGLVAERSRPIVIEIDGREIARVLRDTQADGVVI